MTIFKVFIFITNIIFITWGPLYCFLLFSWLTFWPSLLWFFSLQLSCVQLVLWVSPLHSFPRLLSICQCCLSFLWWWRGSDINDGSLKAFLRSVWTMHKRGVVFLDYHFCDAFFKIKSMPVKRPKFMEAFTKMVCSFSFP